MTTIPDPEAVLRDLRTLWPVLYAALEFGSQEARLYFAGYSADVDSNLAPPLLRYHARRYLRSKGHEAEFECEDLAANGLALRCSGFNIRIRKSDDGKLPVPGHSRVLQAFYAQQLSLDFANGDTNGEPTVNLMVLWNVAADYRLLGLSLACPKTGGIGRDSVQHHWLVSIPIVGDDFGSDGTADDDAPIAPTPDIPMTVRRLLRETGTDSRE